MHGMEVVLPVLKALGGKPSGSVLSLFTKSYQTAAEKLNMVPRGAKRVMLRVCEKHG